MTDLTALAGKVREAIPLTRHLAFEYLGFDGERLRLRAPLEPNHNDKGTFFAGSQAALVTLAGWSLTSVLAEQILPDQAVDVVAVTSSLDYLLPLDIDMVITAESEAADRERFRERLQRRGKASLRIMARADNEQGQPVCQYQGTFLARILKP